MGGLRFALVTTVYPPHHFGGDGIAVQRWARALARRGHEVSVICDADVHTVLGGAAPGAAEDEPGITVHRLRSGVAPLSVLLTHQTGRPVVHGRAIRRLLDAGTFDVIHYHNISAVGGPGILAAGRGLKLYTAHEHWLVCPTHVLWRHNREPCTGRECVRCALAYHRPPQLWRATGLLERHLRHVDAFIALSEFSRAKHREFGFTREMEVIPPFLPDPEPGGEPAVAAPAERGAVRGAPPDVDDRAGVGPESNRPAAVDTKSLHHRPYFLFVGRLERIKGLDDVLPVFAQYEAADLLVIGDGTHRAALERIAAGNPRVRFLGALPHDALARYYAHAVAAIVPTVGFETFGLVVIEAFRHATPALVRRVGPLPELVDATGGGETFVTPAELASAMRRLQADEAGRARLARAAHAGFLAHWTESVVLPRYFALLDRLARARGQTRVVRALEEGWAA